MSNPEEIIRLESDSGGKIWTETMADVKPFGQHAEHEQLQPDGTEQEKVKESLAESIKRGYFEKTPEEVHDRTRLTIDKMKEEVAARRAENRFLMYDEKIVAELERATEEYGPDIEANGVAVVDLMQLATGLSIPLEHKYLLEDKDGGAEGKDYAIKILEDSHRRYFSEQAPDDQRKAMSSILKKMQFKHDLMRGAGNELVVSDIVWDVYKREGRPTFDSSTIYLQPEACGLPPEIQDYKFDLSDEEISLLANAEDDDILANRLKKFLPLPIQEKIVAKMPDDKYKKAVIGSLLLGDIRSDQRISEGRTNFRTFGPHETVEHAKELKKKIEWITPIVHQLNDRGSIESLVSNNGIEVVSNPYEQYVRGGETGDFLGFTGMNWADFATREEREQKQKQLAKEQAVREGNF